MRLRIKTWLPVVAGALTLGAVGSESAAQCTSGCQPPPPPCCQPPPPPPPPPTGCCQPPPPPTYPGGGFNGNFNVNVNVNANANANANANSNLIRARGGGNVYVGGGGGAYFSVDQPYPTVIQGLNVEGGMQVVEQAVQRSRWAFERVVIQALCIDDRNIPHPASQVQPGREIAQGYNGELYRCIAGARLQFTIADFAEQISFEGGQTVICQKGESLWYSDGPAEAAAAYAAEFGDGGPGQPLGGGIVECRPQLAERDCNERSLLRRYGAGLKVLTLWREEIYTAYEQHTVAASAVIVGQSLSLDGGVGGRVF